ALRPHHAFPKEFSRIMFFAFRVEILVQDSWIHLSQVQVGTITNRRHGQRHIKFHQRRFRRPTWALQSVQPLWPLHAVIVSTVESLLICLLQDSNRLYGLWRRLPATAPSQPVAGLSVEFLYRRAVFRKIGPLQIS